MPAKDLRTLEVRSRQEWRSWLRKHHDSTSEIWLIFHKRHTAKTSISYDDSVEEALCFGWVDSLIRRLDDDRYLRKFTPRTADSSWSASNRRRYADLEARGLIAAPGRKRAPTSRRSVRPPRREWPLTPHIAKALKANSRAWEHFQSLAPSHQRAYVGWIDSAKRDETKTKRLQKAVSMLAAGQKLGLK